ncbi:MAG: hypothetical protein ACI8QF_002985 [Limisphaerales bacterium]|jgi:hypothetical protein
MLMKRSEKPAESSLLSRRDFTKRALPTLLTIAMVEHLFRGDLFAGESRSIAVKWLNEVNEIGMDLKSQELKQTEWQKKVKELFERIELAELLKFIDFERLEQSVQMRDNGARSIRFKYPKRPGTPEKLVFGQQIFALKKGRSVVPHGHNNMATAFLVLKGDFHGLHYDRIEDQKKHLIIRPTIDDKFGPGTCSTVSDVKDNIHWFKALKEPAFIFNIHILGFDPDSENRTGRIYVDPKGEKIAGGLIRARLIDSKEAHKRYG